MTIRLDYLDAYQQRFTAQVIEICQRNGLPAVVLDRTCFYPTSGGQLHDTGLLGEVAVREVIAEDGLVLHLLAEAPPFAPGDVIAGAIDWSRRYDHMQQHSGQHLLSQLIYQQFGFETISVHFGRQESTLDLDAATVPATFMEDVEWAANELAVYALEIHTYFVGDAEVSKLPLRRPPAVSGQIRIVEIDGFDYSACGGAHVRTTAEISPIKLLRQERRRGQTRLTFLCGLRACRDYAEKHRLLTETAALFSTSFGETPGLVQKLQRHVQELERQNAELQEAMLAHVVAELIAAAPRVGDIAVVEYHTAERSVDVLKQMCALLRQQPNVVGLLASTAGEKVAIIFCRSDDVAIHVGDLLRDALAAFGGRGGGRPEYAQGGGAPVSAVTEVLHFARQQLMKNG
jgi:alanyl-tRNA synthetase